MLAHRIPVLLRHTPVLPAQLHPLLNPPPIRFAGIIKPLAILLTSVNLHALTRETTRPAADGDQCLWPTPSRLFYVTDSLIGLRFLVDTGAEISVVPPSALDRKHRKDSFSLQAVNNTPIATYGTQLHTLNIGLSCKVSLDIHHCRCPKSNIRSRFSTALQPFG